jgi:phospholipid-binding lipoprotein MlaA
MLRRPAPPLRADRATRRVAAAALAAAVAFGCATTPEQQAIRDDLEPVNRPVFTVNTTLDKWAIRPLARGYKFVTPAVFRRSVSNAQRNFTFPQRFVAIVGQGELEMAGVELGRFLLNSTVGVGGLFDPASRMGLEKYDEDLGQMFARWNIPPGPYIVLPVLGPSTPRDAIGDLLAIPMNPLMWIGVTMPPIGILFALNRRAELDDQIQLARKNSLDYYVFVREAWIQNRMNEIRRDYVTLPEEGELPPDPYVLPDDLYDVPDDEETLVLVPADCLPSPPAEDAGVATAAADCAPAQATP